MDIEAIDVVRDAFMLMLLISAPILGVGLVVGLAVVGLSVASSGQFFLRKSKFLKIKSFNVVFAMSQNGKTRGCTFPAKIYSGHFICFKMTYSCCTS